RATLGVTFPWTPFQSGDNPSYAAGSIQGPGQPRTTPITAKGPTASDLRLDFRGVLSRSSVVKTAIGSQLSIFAPTGTPTNFGGDNGTGALILVNGEHTVKFITLVANLGVHFRPRHAINSPTSGSGLGVGNELRWAVGGFLPIKDGKFRIGGTIFGQTGIESDENLIGDTVFKKANTPIEWQAEGRMKFGPADHWWVGFGGGSRLFTNAYGAPDLRLIGLIGTYIPI